MTSPKEKIMFVATGATKDDLTKIVNAARDWADWRKGEAEEFGDELANDEADQIYRALERLEES